MIRKILVNVESRIYTAVLFTKLHKVGFEEYQSVLARNGLQVENAKPFVLQLSTETQIANLQAVLSEIATVAEIDAFIGITEAEVDGIPFLYVKHILSNGISNDYYFNPKNSGEYRNTLAVPPKWVMNAVSRYINAR